MCLCVCTKYKMMKAYEGATQHTIQQPGQNGPRPAIVS